MMNGRVEFSSFTRLLVLNNRVHDLGNRLLAEPVAATAGAASNGVAELQDEIDRWTRASLALCWLADPGPAVG